MLTKLIELIEFIGLIGLAELIISTNQPFNPINHQSLGSGFWVLGSEVQGSILTKLIELIGKRIKVKG
jgi:hypothetical protein